MIGVPRAAIRKVVAGDVEVGRDGAAERGGGLGDFSVEEDEAIAENDPNSQSYRFFFTSDPEIVDLLKLEG